MISKTMKYSYKEEKLRVAAYCWVSTDHPEQIGSLETQKSYFETIIRNNPNWQFVKIYSDIGSALRSQNRPGYCQMILDGEKNLFDLVLVKALSRFGRDTIETLTQIRKWKQMNIGLYAEMEGIDTMKVNDSTQPVKNKKQKFIKTEHPIAIFIFLSLKLHVYVQLFLVIEVIVKETFIFHEKECQNDRRKL